MIGLVKYPQAIGWLKNHYHFFCVSLIIGRVGVAYLFAHIPRIQNAANPHRASWTAKESFLLIYQAEQVIRCLSRHFM